MPFGWSTTSFELQLGGVVTQTRLNDHAAMHPLSTMWRATLLPDIVRPSSTSGDRLIHRILVLLVKYYAGAQTVVPFFWGRRELRSLIFIDARTCYHHYPFGGEFQDRISSWSSAVGFLREGGVTSGATTLPTCPVPL